MNAVRVVSVSIERTVVTQLCKYLLAIQTEDAGPGIADPEWALADGHSSTGGLGLGFGTVNRPLRRPECAAAHPRVQGGGPSKPCDRGEDRINLLRRIEQTGRQPRVCGRI